MASPATISRCGVIFVYPTLIDKNYYMNKFFREYDFPF